MRDGLLGNSEPLEGPSAGLNSDAIHLSARLQPLPSNSDPSCWVVTRRSPLVLPLPLSMAQIADRIRCLVCRLDCLRSACFKAKSVALASKTPIPINCRKPTGWKKLSSFRPCPKSRGGTCSALLRCPSAAAHCKACVSSDTSESPTPKAVTLGLEKFSDSNLHRSEYLPKVCTSSSEKTLVLAPSPHVEASTAVTTLFQPIERSCQIWKYPTQDLQLPTNRTPQAMTVMVMSMDKTVCITKNRQGFTSTETDKCCATNDLFELASGNSTQLEEVLYAQPNSPYPVRQRLDLRPTELPPKHFDGLV